jgi:hypothetical protein
MPAYTYSGPEVIFHDLRDEDGTFVGRVAAGDIRHLHERDARTLTFWHPARGRPEPAPPDTEPALPQARSSKGGGK